MSAPDIANPVSVCAGCNRPIPAGMRKRRIYCSASCRHRVANGTSIGPDYSDAPLECASRIFVRSCIQCDRLFVARDWQKSVCSKKCQYRRGDERRSAAQREARYLSAKERGNFRRSGAKYNQTAAGRAVSRRRNDLRRALTRGAADVERFDHADIFKRDRWVCQICRKRVDPSLAWPDPGSPSLDHIVPIAAGGDHSRANAQLAHLVCNLAKGDRARNDQLRLLG